MKLRDRSKRAIGSETYGNMMENVEKLQDSHVRIPEMRTDARASWFVISLERVSVS